MRTDQREVEALNKIAKTHPHQASISHMHANGTCFVCGDEDDVAWYRWQTGGPEGLFCSDCKTMQEGMPGPGGKLMPVLLEEAPEDFDEADAYDVDPMNPDDPTNM